MGSSLGWFINDKVNDVLSETLAKNDGLSDDDFREWFKKIDFSKPMAIIHFTDFRYSNHKPKIKPMKLIDIFFLAVIAGALLCAKFCRLKRKNRKVFWCKKNGKWMIDQDKS